MHDDSAVALIQTEDDVAARHLEAVAAVVVESQRPSTRKAYAAAWKRFQDWAVEEGARSLPADPVTVAAYLVHRDATGLSFASLAMDRKAISFVHRRAGLPVAHRFGRGQDDHGRGQEPRCRTRKVGAEAGARAPGSGPESHCRHGTHTQDLPVRAHGISRGRHIAGGGGHRDRVRDERRAAPTWRSRSPAMGRRGVPT